MLIRLEVIGGPNRGREFELVHDGVYILGRSKKCHFSIPSDPHISGVHIAFKVDSAARTCVWQRMPDARNPVVVNDKRLTAGQLKTGDLIKVGFAQLKMVIDWDREVSFYSCVECDRSVYLLQSDVGTLRKVVCEDCRSRPGSENVQQESSEEYFQCTDCGKDVKEKANCDQRAFEYYGVADYLCDDCCSRYESDMSFKGSSTTYQLLKELGKGGMGVVYLGRCSETGRLVAVKNATGSHEERFKREMTLMQRLRHPNIVRYIEWVEGWQSPRLVMQYVKGPSLHDFIIDNFESTSTEERLEIFGQIINAVSYMHSQVDSRIIHRDLKPENVLIRSEKGSGYQAYVTDFGLGCDLEDDSRMTKFGVRMGTPSFSAPEQMKNARNTDERSDVYSLGVLGYYLITGKLPFGLPSPYEASIDARRKGLDFRDRDTLITTQDDLTRGRGLGENFQMAAFRSILSKNRPALEIPDDLAATGIQETIKTALALDASQRFDSAVSLRKHFHQNAHMSSNPA